MLKQLYRARRASRRNLARSAWSGLRWAVQEAWRHRGWMPLRSSLRPAELSASICFAWIEDGLVELDDDYVYFVQPWWAAG